MERHPTLEYVTTNSPDGRRADRQRHLSQRSLDVGGRGIVVLKSPAVPKKLSAEFYIPPNAPARQVTLLLDGREVATHTYPDRAHTSSHPPNRCRALRWRSAWTGPSPPLAISARSAWC